MKAQSTRSPLAVPAPLDQAFDPMIVAVKAAREASTGERLAIAWERESGGMARYDLALPADFADWSADRIFRLAERVVKFLLWSSGGWRLMVAGPEGLCRRLQKEYSEQGRRAFDADLMKKVYGRPLTVEVLPLAKMPHATDAAIAAGGNLDGYRLGFDLGASDFKIWAVDHGKVVFSDEFPWDPKTQSDPEYHYVRLNEGLKKAASFLPRVDAIGGSTAGVVVANRIMEASLFRAVPPARYAEAQNLFGRLQQEWRVPVELANDGDVTALAGALSLKTKAILGVAMGSSEAAGYFDRKGRLTGRLTELAFAPVDFNPASAADEWSGDAGVGAMYLSQQAVNKLAPAAGWAIRCRSQSAGGEIMSRSQTPYLHWIAEFDSWAKAGRSLPLGGLTPPTQPTVDQSAAKVLLFSPHPDDECITGALPLRLAREAGLQIVNVAVTLGSNKARQAGRWAELQQACSFLNWSVECSTPGGLARITPKARAEEPDHWCGAIEVIQNILTRHQPKFVVFPHCADWNASHIGTHYLVMDALATMPAGFRCGLIETEFWGAMATPNLMVESSVSEVADLVEALSRHVGEVQRNPYHLTLPAWMQDTVRRGGEIVGGQGGAAPEYRFATLYRAGLWRDRARHDLPAGSARFLPTGERVMKQWLEDVSWK